MQAQKQQTSTVNAIQLLQAEYKSIRKPSLLTKDY